MDSTQFTQNSGDDENVLGLLWAKYFPYWPFYLILLVISLAGTWFYVQKTAPLYEATATLLIKDERKGIDDSRMIESLNLLSTKKIVENELEVLGSRFMMEEIVKTLKLYAPVYRKGKWRYISAYSSSPIRVEAKTPSEIIENRKIEFSFDSTTQTVTIGNTPYPLNKWDTTPFGVLRFIPTKPKITTETGQLHFALINPKNVVATTMAQLDATPSNKLSTIINLKLKNEDPLLAEDILNQLIVNYNRNAVNEKNLLATNTLSFVQERLDVVGRHLDSIERKIQQYKAKEGAIDISSQGKIFLDNVGQNDQKVAEINMQLAALVEVEKYVLQNDKTGSIVPSTIDEPGSLLSSMLKKLYDLELEKEKLKKNTGENNSIMVSITDQIEKIKPNILENIQSQRKSLEARRTNLGSTSNAYSSFLQTIPQKERDLVEISRQQNIENNIYAFLLQKREEASLSNSSTVADNRLVDKASASLHPVSPNKKLIYAIACMLALGAGVAVIAVKDLLNHNILYKSEIEKLCAFPVVAEIGLNKTKDEIVIQAGKTSAIAEQFRRLRSSLKFMGVGPDKKKILVTSTVTGDGKSFITANLGYALALAGKKIVLLEADLSNPSLSEKLSMREKQGLSNYLNGECEINAVVKQTDLNSNLFLISAGTLPPNPSELLMNGKMEGLLEYLENKFDYVLLDTAPVAALSDAYFLAPLCDATIYVVRHAHTPKWGVEKLDKTNRIHALKNLSIVFNGIATRGFGNNGYGDLNGYGHEYKTKRKYKINQQGK
ncbi:MAG: polysaccharide biosynthesis tyrosine autokinase [Chitinophagaceae bacterium]